MENNDFERLPASGDNLYNEKNDSVIVPDSYYSDLTEIKKNEEERYDEVFDSAKPRTLGWSIASMVLGIISVLYGFIGWVGLIIGAVAIALAIVSRVRLGYFNSMAIAGLLLGIFGVVFGAFYLVISSIFGIDGIFDMFSGVSDNVGDNGTITDI
ncbi:MAG: DUF4190 domain-containing protein [Clostridia bacterium]|nr:DUF4190 domain-containing protein [Clostridia bacterium]